MVVEEVGELQDEPVGDVDAGEEHRSNVCSGAKSERVVAVKLTDRLLTAREVGELVGLSTETILRRWRAGEIPGFRLASNVLRFDPGDVEAWLKDCKQPGRGRCETA